MFFEFDSRLPLAVLGSLFLAVGEVLAQVSDDFNDGNDAGWTRYEPLAPFGAPGIYTFPNGAYRIEATPSLDPVAVGAARAGSLRLDAPSSAWSVNWYTVDWDKNLNQSFGAVVGGSSLGRNTTDAWAFTYSTAGAINLLRIQDEQPTVLASTPIALDPLQDYYFLFRIRAGAFLGEVYQLDSERIGSVEFVDHTYTAGFAGLYVFSNLAAGAADATFDQFEIAIIPEPCTCALLGLGAIAVFQAVQSRRAKCLKLRKEI